MLSQDHLWDSLPTSITRPRAAVVGGKTQQGRWHLLVRAEELHGHTVGWLLWSKKGMGLGLVAEPHLARKSPWVPSLALLQQK